LRFSPFSSFANRIGDFISLSETEANTPLLITYYDQGAEAETTSTFDDLCRSIDEDRLFNKSVIAIAFGLLVATTRPVPTIATMIPTSIRAIDSRRGGHWRRLG